MIDGPYFVLTVLGVLGCGLVAGVFCGFSTFVMKGLAALPPAQGVAAMQAINVAALTPGVHARVHRVGGDCAPCSRWSRSCCWPDEGTVELLLGSALYLFGCVRGDDRRERPAQRRRSPRWTPAAPEAAAYWPTYVREWTMWNHVRTVASAAASISYVLALT